MDIEIRALNRSEQAWVACWLVKQWGSEIVAVHRNAVTQSRQIKPQIPLVGNDGIPIRDEIELEMLLKGASHA